MQSTARQLLHATVMFLLVGLSCSAATPAATSSTSVGVDIPGVTSISNAACRSRTTATTLGTLLPGSAVVTTAPCTVVFGSSNSTSQLRMSQADGAGSAMNHPSSGSIDAGWGTSGVATYVTPGDDDPAGIGLQSTGAVVQVFSDGDFHAVRRDSVGATDATFGTAGLATKDNVATDGAHAMVVQPDDAIVYAGYAVMPSPNDSDSVIGRFTANGSVDTGFGTNGVVTVDVGQNDDDQAMNVQMQADGRILVQGWYSEGPIEHVYLLRLTSTGALDPTFGAGGIFRDSTASGGHDAEGGTFVQQSDGKIVLVTMDWYGLKDTYSIRVRSNGTLDPTYGTAGRSEIDFVPGEDDYPRVSLVREDDTILVAGNSPSDDFGYVSALTRDGARDTTWGTNGYVRVDSFGPDVHRLDAGIVEQNGKVLVAGMADDPPSASSSSQVVYRLSSNGSADPTFGGGAGHVSFTQPSPETGGAGLLDFDGAVLVGGTSNDDAFVARLDDGGAFADYGAGHLWASGTTSSLFGVCLASVSSATNVWPVAPGATCDRTDGAYWRAVPTRRGAGAAVATSATGVSGASVDLYFGAKAANDTAAGAHVAPITFDVLAP